MWIALWCRINSAFLSVSLDLSTTASNQPINSLTDRCVCTEVSAMAGLVHIDSPLSKVEVAPVRTHQMLLLAGGVLCLLSAWYFALAIAPTALGASAPTMQQGLLPEWFGGREILHGRSPYRLEVTQQVELAIYGETVSASSPNNQHRFAYPVIFIFLFFPIALLPFDVAQWVMLAACVALSVLSVGWWTGRARLSKLDTVSFAILTFAAYPTVVGLQLRQPTLMVAALLAFSVCRARSGRLVWAGVCRRSGRCKTAAGGRSPASVIRVGYLLLANPQSISHLARHISSGVNARVRAGSPWLDNSLAQYHTRLFTLRGRPAATG